MLCSNEMDLCFAFLMFFYLNLYLDEMDLDAEWSLCGRRRTKSYVETSIGHYALHLCFISILCLMRWIWMQNGRFVVDGVQNRTSRPQSAIMRQIHPSAVPSLFGARDNIIL